jgi:hypothetical protein
MCQRIRLVRYADIESGPGLSAWLSFKLTEGSATTYNQNACHNRVAPSFNG